MGHDKSKWITFKEPKQITHISTPFPHPLVIDLPSIIPDNACKIALTVFTRSGNEPPSASYFYTFSTEVNGEPFYHHTFMFSYPQGATSYGSERVKLPYSKRLFVESNRQTASNNHGVTIYLSGYKIKQA